MAPANRLRHAHALTLNPSTLSLNLDTITSILTVDVMKMPSEFTVTSKTRTRSSLVFHQNTPRLYQKHTGNLRCTLEAQKNSSQQTMAWDLSNTSLIWNKW